MKLIACTILAATLILPLSAFANSHGCDCSGDSHEHGCSYGSENSDRGYDPNDAKYAINAQQAPTYNTYTVAELPSITKDTTVKLIGKIVSRVDGTHDKYIFKDATGTAIVEIKPRAFNNLVVKPDMDLTLIAKIDIEHKNSAKEMEVEVDSVTFN